jgi:putative chitinase
MKKLTNDMLRAIAPGIAKDKVALYIPLLNKWMPYYSINTKLRQAAFLAQILHETDNLQYTEEVASGKKYEGRKDLGNTKKGDGERYKGCGCIMITGRANYAAVSKGLGVDFVSHPELLKEPNYAVQSACWWWTIHGLNALADKGDFMAITKKINGGYNGYIDRVIYYKRALAVLN